MGTCYGSFLLLYSNNPASMDFIENRVISQLSVQDAIIAAKIEQSHYINKNQKPDPDISVTDIVLVLNESQMQYLSKGYQKLTTKLIGPYKVIKVDKSNSNYTLDIPVSRRHKHLPYQLPSEVSEPSPRAIPKQTKALTLDFPCRTGLEY